MKAGDVMTLGAATVGPDDSIAKAARLMLDHRISGLPVVDEAGKLVGIISEGDLIRRAETGTERSRPGWLIFLFGAGSAAEDYARSHGRKVGEVMTEEVVTAGPETPVEEIVDLMEGCGIKRVPIMRDGEVVGIVSRSNLLRSLARQADDALPMGTDDQAIRSRIMKELDTQRWAPRASVDVIVHGGVVELQGTIGDERVRQAIRIAAENTPGVTQVNDKLVWIEPLTGSI